MIEIFIGGDLRREVEGVAAARHCALRSKRGVDARAAAAAVLPPHHLHELVVHLDDVDHLALFELTFEDHKLAATARADLVGGVEFVGLLHNRQLGLWRWA